MPQIVARIEQLPFAEESFDIVLSNAVFDKCVYDQDQQLMMQEISRVLKHGGLYLGHNEDWGYRKDVLLPIEGFNQISDNSIYKLGTVHKKS